MGDFEDWLQEKSAAQETAPAPSQQPQGIKNNRFEGLRPHPYALVAVLGGMARRNVHPLQAILQPLSLVACKT
jgi:hypothetical protein